MPVPALMLLPLCSFLVDAEHTTATFLYPLEGHIFNILDTVVLEWTSDYTFPTLFI